MHGFSLAHSLTSLRVLADECGDELQAGYRRRSQVHHLELGKPPRQGRYPVPWCQLDRVLLHSRSNTQHESEIRRKGTRGVEHKAIRGCCRFHDKVHLLVGNALKLHSETDPGNMLQTQR